MSNKQKFNTPELSVEELNKALYEVTLQLQESNNKLQLEQKKKTEFYANISHDLRAPITAISNSVQYLLSQDNISTEEQSEILSIMQKRISYLENLINDIFLLSSLDSSAQKVHKEPVDIRFFLEDFFYMCEDDAKYEGADLELNLADDFDAVLNIDPHLMQRVLDNLFSNALKYSGSNPKIVLNGKIANATVIISVCDNGVGIAKEHLDKIFERSYQIEKARTPDATKGSGFGLSIVRSIIEHHSGSIHCESTPDVGSEFIITLPVIE